MGSKPQTYSELVNFVLKSIITDGVIPLLFAFAVVYFLWGGLKFIQSAGDGKGREEGKKRMMHGLIGLAVMISVWGLVKIVLGTIGITTMSIPQFK